MSEFRALGSGYSVITEGLARALHARDVEVKVLSMSYQGEPHELPVSVIPVLDPSFLLQQIEAIVRDWLPEAVVVALDLPHQKSIWDALKNATGHFRRVGIFPIEGAPLYSEWAETIEGLDGRLTLSAFGVQTCAEQFIEVRHLPIARPHGIGTAGPMDAATMRQHVELVDRFTILKIADNHQRKNWAHTLEYFARWHSPDDVLIGLTRPENAYGWDLRDLAQRLGATRVPETTVYRWADGAEFRLLSNLTVSDKAWLLNVCDVLLVDSGNEGLCLPILEAFAVGLPVVGMKHTAVNELLAEGRGVLFSCGYEYTDTFGNVRRWYPQYESWATALNEVKYMPARARSEMVANGARWLKGQSWEAAAEVLLGEIEGVGR